MVKKIQNRQIGFKTIIIGNTINLTEPNIENIKNNLTYLRAEADSLALEFRLHSKDKTMLSIPSWFWFVIFAVLHFFSPLEIAFLVEGF